jgi:hypothetical protein
MSDLGPLDGCLRVYYKPFGRGYNLRRAKQEPKRSLKGGNKKEKEKIAASKTTGRMAAFIHSAKCLLPYPANPFLFSFYFLSSPASLLCVSVLLLPLLARAQQWEISPSNPWKEEKLFIIRLRAHIDEREKRTPFELPGSRLLSFISFSLSIAT